MQELALNEIHQMDCLEGMALLPDRSIDLIYCDLPYGVTENEWDTVIPSGPLWAQYNRLIKDNGAIVLHSQQPFTTDLINGNRKHYRYNWVWSKTYCTGAWSVKQRPMREHEDICVFYRKRCTYNPQMREGAMKTRKEKRITSSNYKEYTMQARTSNLYYPKSILHFPAVRRKGQHPTEKPVPLAEYIIRTYTNPGDIVLDNCMGSGTTAVAAEKAGRHWIGFETCGEYVARANERLRELREGAGQREE